MQHRRSAIGQKEQTMDREAAGRVQHGQGGHTPKVCIVGASGKLGRYMVQHALDRGYEVVGVCREQSIHS
jgi:NADPH:quinone reductase-like Zn-dependent oxidoreductase